MNMKDTLRQMKEEALEKINEVGADLEQIRVRYLGKKGELTAVLRGMGQLSAEERPVVGQIANEVRANIEEALTRRAEEMKAKALEMKLKAEKLDVTMPGKAPTMGHIHPLTLVQRDLEDIFMGMGFSIVEGPEVEYDYYNFEALNIPKNHPARDAQDTFFISDPATTNTVPEDYLEDVAKIHSEGGFGSFGYGYDWDRKEAMKNILRTHTTCVSTKELYKAAKDPEGFKPMRCFSIDRVFRNETMDATHLAEFHQVELFVADRNLNLGHLIGMIKDFFAKIGITDVRFKPAFNPLFLLVGGDA